MMEHKGYFAKIEFDDDAGIFHGEVVNLRDVITFEGQSVKEIKQAFQESVDDYLEFCAQRGENPEKPYSGKFVVRVEPELHKKVTMEALKSGKSLNVWINDAISEASSKGERGKFYRPDLKLSNPVYLEEEVSSFVEKLASKKGVDRSSVVNELIKDDMTKQ